jgi:hypothetical protein
MGAELKPRRGRQAKGGFVGGVSSPRELRRALGVAGWGTPPMSNTIRSLLAVVVFERLRPEKHPRRG